LATAESLLADVPLFQSLDAAERSTLAGSVTVVDFAPGTRVFRRGDPGGSLYVVSRGLVEISVETTTGDRVLLDQMGPGDFFGEISLLDGRERTADATATGETRAFEIDRADLEELFRKHPDAALDVLEVVGRRLREADRLLQSQSSVSPNQEVSERTTPVQRVAESLARFSGSIPFLVWHALLFLVWILVNLNLLSFVRGFDPFPFGFLTMAVSLESIFLSCFVLIAQNRQAAGDRIRSDVEFAANIRAGKEVTQLHGKVDTLYSEIMARLALLDRTVSGPRPPPSG
jgi:CRP/FNR family transcriptional regulator, cyclic AMP receptor protein